MNRRILTLLTLLHIISCTSRNKNLTYAKTEIAIVTEFHNDSLLPFEKVSSKDFTFFADSVLHGHADVLKYYFQKYIPDSCNHFHLTKSDVIRNFEGTIFIGDINQNNIKDSVFVLAPISYCKFVEESDSDGDAYYFTDTTLPRLQTSSECCHPNNLFLVGDIDEDGVSEIGQFYSSCASHYKSLYVYSLKNRKWQVVGHSTFDIFFMDVNKPLSFWVRKTKKKKFEMLQITDLTKKSKIGKKDWLKFSML